MSTIHIEISAQAQRTGILEGTVTDKATGEPIPGANVVLAGTKFGAATDSTGNYRIYQLPPGTYNISITVIGYKRAQASVVVSIWDTAQQDFALEVQPIPLEEIEAEAPRAELEKEIQISVQELRGAELQMAGSSAQADLFRTIQTLPAVAQASDFSSELYIRGGSPDQNLILLDGATIYNPFHFTGFFGAFNSIGIESAELFAGGYPARYGGRASSVLDIKNKVGDSEVYHGQFNINLLSASGLVEGPIPRGSFCLSGRRLFQSYLNTLNRSGIYGTKMPPYRFYDFQGKTVTQITPSNRLVFSGYWADDFMEGYEETKSPYMIKHLNFYLFASRQRYGEEYDAHLRVINILRGHKDRFNLDVDWGNRAGSAVWQYLPGESFNASVAYSASRFHSYLDVLDNTIYPPSFKFDEGIDDRSFAGDLVWAPADRLQLRAGMSRKKIAIDYLLTSPKEKLQPQLFPVESDFAQIQAKRRSEELSAYLESSLSMGKGLLLNTGLRWTRSEVRPNHIPDIHSYNFMNYSHEIRHFEPVSREYIEPRLGIKYNPDEDNFFKFAWGVYHQNLFLIPLRSGSNMTVLNLWFPLDGKYQPLRADHYILGYKRYLPGGLSLSAELYYKELDHFLEQSDEFLSDDPYSYFDEKSGRVRGLELLIRRQSSNTYGWIGYSLSKADTRSDEGAHSLWFDQRHRINFVLHWFSYDRRWEATWSWTYSSGLPYTKIIADCITLDLDGSSEPEGTGGYSFLPVNMNGRKHAWQYQAYHRMDLSVKRLLIKQPLTLSASLWFVNLYNHQNVFFYRYQGAYTHPSKITMLPGIPFFGLEGRF